MKPISSSEFNMSSFWGRCQYYNSITNPVIFFTAPWRIRQAKERMTHLETKNPYTSEEQKEYQQCARIVRSIEHPDTGKPIPFYGRMSGFIPINMPMIFLMIMARPTQLNIIIGQWANQSYNAVMNYSNRNATSPYTLTDIMRGYSSAVVISVGVALLLQNLFRPVIERVPSRGKQLVYRAVLTFIAAGLAGSSNVYMMRQKELTAGISIFNPQTNQDLGKSQVAAKKAVYFTAASRPFMSLPVFILPAVMSFLFEKMKIMPKNKPGKIVLELGFCAFSLWLGLVGSISLFEQDVLIQAEQLEPQFRNIKDAKNGEILRVLKYNKGL